ncbi:hypothetical protein EVAR_34032_1 [Eumeta japonica]|uniref:Uncharacterized protein n=1 Tax=Eumeta variegata TaxID=151549 RepID=A0A4C1VTT1_EUMVA|nr:hypothetical protein EVAR_34032_1 [Eumeta japonica]
MFRDTTRCRPAPLSVKYTRVIPLALFKCMLTRPAYRKWDAAARAGAGARRGAKGVATKWFVPKAVSPLGYVAFPVQRRKPISAYREDRKKDAGILRVNGAPEPPASADEERYAVTRGAPVPARAALSSFGNHRLTFVNYTRAPRRRGRASVGTSLCLC